MGLWPEREQQPDAIEAVYDYTDEHGALLYQIVREPRKKFLQGYPDGAGGWIWKKHPNQVLYRLSEVLRNQIIFLCEGEKDCETLCVIRSRGHLRGGRRERKMARFIHGGARTARTD